MNFEEMLFLKESYNETIDNYTKVLKGIKKFGWDWVIITASNENQANSYKTQIELRKSQNLIPNVRIDVIPDENDKRIGSGGATLNVLRFLSENDSGWLNKKILLIHSGGDSKRIPQYSSCGKLFSHVPRELLDNKPSTLFDEFLVSLSLVPDRLKNGILVVSGDVLLLFNYLQIDVDLENSIAISMKEDVEIGKNHGVFLTNASGLLEEFLHKNTVSKLEEHGAIDKFNMVDIDTGLIWLDNNICGDLLSLITTNGKIDKKKKKKYINDVNRLSFYGDLLYPLSNNGTLEKYLETSSEGILDENLLECRRNIWYLLNKYNMKVVKTSPSKFIHEGTTRELLDLNVHAYEKYSFLNWSNSVMSNLKVENCSLINSYIEENVLFGNNCFVEDSILKNAKLGNNCIITGTCFSGELPDNIVLQVLPIKLDKNKYFVSRVYGVYDNPKDDNILFGNNIIDAFEKYGVSRNQIWRTKDSSLWNANLYEVCKTESDAILAADRLIRIFTGSASEDDISIWKNGMKLSLATSFAIADMETITDRQNKIDILVRTSLIKKNFYNGKSVEKCCRLINKKNVKQIVRELKKQLKSNDYKLNILLSYITQTYSELFDYESQYYEDECYKQIKLECIDENKFEINPPDKEVSLKTPVRINFAGGWSDTPPYCIENGGTVLNAAISLDNRYPIEVVVRKYEKGKYRFQSIDHSSIIEYDSIDDVKKLNSVGNPFLLTKAALLCLNIIDTPYLEEYGIEIITNVDVPAGSGLGTSSILAATILKALIKFYDMDVNTNEIFDLVLKLEQLISTGGGWQDQIGGLIPGIKLIETEPGTRQEYKITRLDCKLEKKLNDRMILVYTGQRRIAKNLLRKIMNSYLLNEDISKTNLKKIQHLAFVMKFELEKGNLDRFAQLLTEHFNLIREIDSSVSNVAIDHIISTIEPYVQGYTIAGAGGGGFIFAVMKEGVTKEEIINKISAVYKENGVKVYDCSFVDKL